MIRVCIYQKNRGLGACVGPVSRIKVTDKKTRAWKGLHDLAERLKAEDEEPGVCTAHAQRGADNGYVLDLETTAPAGQLPAKKRISAAASSIQSTATGQGHSGRE